MLVALVTALSMLVRTSFVELRKLDLVQQDADHATGAISVAQAELAREQIIAERAALAYEAARAANTFAEDRERRARIDQFAVITQQRLEIAGDALNALSGAPSIRDETTRHAAFLRKLRHTSDYSVARELEPLNDSLSRKLEEVRGLRERTVASVENDRQVLRARLIAACGFSILTAVALSAATIFFVVLPLRRTAATARRIGQGELQKRIEWSVHDDLGTIATELNRMAIRLRDLRETEAGRRQMEHQLSDAVVQSIFEPVIVTDARGQLLKLNQAAREMLGEAAADRMALTNTPGGDKILSAIASAVSMQRAMAAEGEAALLPMRVGQAQRQYRLRTTPMRDSEGRLLGAVTVLEDVTELQDLDRFKSRFLSVASQKLRDPLQQLRVALHALARGYAGELRPLQADVLQGAEDEALRMDELMSDLFEVAELESGRRTLKVEQLRPIDLLQEARERIRTQAQERSIEVEINAFADLSRVNADRRAIRSIFENLLTNALRYTPPGGLICLEATELPDKVQFIVRDNGRGIETERLARIFGRFTGAGDLESESVPGPTSGLASLARTNPNPPAGNNTGLGLALVRRLVESHGGQISVESRVGHGTTFSFTIPVARVSVPRHPVEAG